jgi:hypothetical protein
MQISNNNGSFLFHLQRATAANGTDLYVIVYNSLGWARSTVIHLPVSKNGIYQVTKIGSQCDEAVLVLSHPSSSTSISGGAKYVVNFATGHLPPLGASVFQISMTKNSTASVKSSALKTETLLTQEEYRHRANTADVTSKDVEASNEFFSVVFDGYVKLP